MKKLLLILMMSTVAITSMSCSSTNDNEEISSIKDEDSNGNGEQESDTTSKDTTANITLANATTALEVDKALGFGWNLGNHFDTHNNGERFPEEWGTWWDTATPTEQLYKSLADAGVSTVRIPVTWGVWESAAPEYTIDSTFMALVKQNVHWAKAAGLNVILNTHHDEYWLDIYKASLDISVNNAIKERIVATWQQIAEAFKDEGSYLVLETFNEIHGFDGTTEDWGWGASTEDNGRQYAVLNEWNQLALTTIRNTGGNNATRWIMINGFAANPTISMKSLEIPSDPAKKIIVGVHCYDPYNFTISLDIIDTWGHNAGNSYDESNITDLFAKLKSVYIDNNIPCYMGEFGCSMHTTTLGERCRMYYQEYFARALHEYGLTGALWDNNVKTAGSESHCYFDHNDGSLVPSNENITHTMIKAMTSDDTSYTLESIFNRAPSK